jgi:hypothetical protein
MQSTNLLNLLTVLGGAFITVLPQIVSAIPSPYRDIASGVLAAILAAWHLYQPSPTAPVVAVPAATIVVPPSTK